jgi:bifunctional DNA-binding transcriptional regulator/antitoxin component of YhaV-PrlF toxin-antitoxin module
MEQIPQKFFTGTMTTKRQVTVPIAVCNKLGVDAGDMIGFVVTECGKVELVNFDELAILKLREEYGENFETFKQEDIQNVLNAVKTLKRGTKN